MAVLVRPGVMPMELGIVHQLFGAATAPDGRALYELVTCAPRPGTMSTDADFTIRVDHGLEVMNRADTVLVPASHACDETDEPIDARTAEVLAGLGQPTRVASICTGAFALAAAGLLDGRRATTHWMSAELFRRRYQLVDLDPDVLFTSDGHVLTSAGEASGIDLCLHMIGQDHGATVANDVARRTIVPPHRDGGQAQYIPSPVPEPRRSTTATARAWALAHLAESISLRDLAAREALSVRTFTRRFHAEVGVSAGQWLIRQRIDRARELLETTDLSIDQVARSAGLGTSASLRQQLRAVLGVSPTTYRTTFRRAPTMSAASPAAGTSP